jgi:HAE1 family hydrophobic/amphiphilic exporter-1
VLGGLSFGTLMTLFLMPTVYAIMNKHSDDREARAEARRERIAAGIKKEKRGKQRKAIAAGADFVSTGSETAVDLRTFSSDPRDVDPPADALWPPAGEAGI